MDIWRIFEVLCIFGMLTVVSGHPHSDPHDISNAVLFDDAAHVPGEPLNPIDYQNADIVGHGSPPNGTSDTDPILIAGLFEGDIILTSHRNKTSKSDTHDEEPRNGIIYEKQKWVGGVVPYLISSQFNTAERGVLAKAMNEYHTKTCLKFTPRTTEKDYIHITKGQGCSSLVGRSGGAQPVSLGQGCVYPGIAVHEFMHAVGFWHEQSRPDRDTFVTVFNSNIQKGMEFNFKKYDWSHVQNLSAPYDLGSVMHYGAYAFSKDRRSATILPKDPNKKIGQRDGFSQTDLLKINRLYKCSGSGGSVGAKPPTTTSPAPSGCSDNHKHCAYWAGKGECASNKAWMLVNCKKSCSVCGKCDDLNKYCSAFASRGDCTKNPDYMRTYCSKSCKACGDDDVPETTTTTTASPEVIICEDRERFCPYWAAHEECSKNSKFMAKYCPKSCHLC